MKDFTGKTRKKNSSEYSILEEEFERVRFQPLENPLSGVEDDEDITTPQELNNYFEYTKIIVEKQQKEQQEIPVQHESTLELPPGTMQPRFKLSKIDPQKNLEKIVDAQNGDQGEGSSGIKKLSTWENLEEAEDENMDSVSQKRISMKKAGQLVKMSNQLNSKVCLRNFKS